MLIFYSALRAVPGELYEAAEIDGATSIGVVRWIKLPALRQAFIVALIFSVIGSLQLFNEPNILQQLAPDTIARNFTPNMYAYNLSFAGQEYNYSAAIAIVMGVITVIIADAGAAGTASGGQRHDACSRTATAGDAAEREAASGSAAAARRRGAAAARASDIPCCSAW